MSLPLRPPIKPQLALSRKQLPDDDGWAYEPKYDGFRALAFVDGDELYLQSRGSKPLARYFPELVFPEGRYVLDGELAHARRRRHEIFDAAREPHPPGRVTGEDARRTDPRIFRAFDLLAVGGGKLARRRRSPSVGTALAKLFKGWKDPGSVS